jgi:hypothetical protein
MDLVLDVCVRKPIMDPLIGKVVLYHVIEADKGPKQTHSAGAGARKLEL